MAAITLADLCLWSVARPGLALVVLLAGLGGLAILLAPRRRGQAAAILTLGLIPLIEAASPLSILFALGGLAGAMLALAGQVMRPGAWASLPVTAMLRPFEDGQRIATHPGASIGGMRHRLAGAVRNWGPALGLGSIFALMFVAANPVLGDWLSRWSGPAWTPDPARIAFWLLVALLAWPVLRGPVALPQGPARAAPSRPGLLTEGGVIRALLTFNALFAVQTLMDAAYLWGGAALPEGMTYATYAHRGAYPLLLTALMAGGFALMAAPFAGRGLIRGLLLAWVAQTVALVGSSILRLDLYIGVYGLTHWRIAALIWMGLVAAGLALMLVQIARRHGPGWLALRSGALALVTLYATCFVNLDGLIARTNLARGVKGEAYLCTLSEGALPAILAWEAAHPRPLCVWGERPSLTSPADWREWGYRNHRLRLSLSATDREP
jgi:hypothetical protein